MKNRIIYNFLLLVITGALAASCTGMKEEAPDNRDKGELRMGVSFGNSTRVTELTDPNQMAQEMEGNGLKNVGLYVYYTSDYSRGDLSRPYVRNRECTVVNGELLIIQEEGANPVDERIFIYDEMTIVAFYPYNPTVADFSVKADEELYPITRDDYSQQYYIPYRAEARTDPTRSYYVQMVFYPKHTYKLEITVVSDDNSQLPTTGIQLLPSIDPVGNAVPEDGIRAVWFDRLIENPNRTGGSNVNQYVGYLWTKDGNKNDIKRGDILMESANLTLIASQDVYVNEQNIYRYGYNMTTGEIFIPTSSTIIHDMESLEAVNNSTEDAYQACPIDLSSNPNWTPINIYGGRYDGGGHTISGLTINSTAGNTPDNMAGLFGQIQGNTTVANVNLLNPTITVTNPDDTAPYYVGALAGRLNTPLSAEAREALIANVPPDISPIVREALIQELMANMGNTTANIVACRVENPTITVTGGLPHVGTITGQAGDSDQEGEYKSRIWDTYSTGGSISVNAGAPQNNANGYIGGFAGLNNGSIDRSYTTIDNITPATTAATDPSTGFAVQGTVLAAQDGYIRDSYSILPDANAGVQQMPGSWPSGWATYQGVWPINTTGWLSGPSNSFWYGTGNPPADYPALQWQRR